MCLFLFFFVLFYVEVILSALETCYLRKEKIRDVIDRMQSDWTAISKSERTKKTNKPTTQENSSPSGGEFEIWSIVFLQQMIIEV